MIIRVRGCKNHVFGYGRFLIILGTISEVILEPKMRPKSHCDSLWAPSVAILTLRWNAEKSNAKGDRFFPELLEKGGGFEGSAAWGGPC